MFLLYCFVVAFFLFIFSSKQRRGGWVGWHGMGGFNTQVSDRSDEFLVSLFIRNICAAQHIFINFHRDKDGPYCPKKSHLVVHTVLILHKRGGILPPPFSYFSVLLEGDEVLLRFYLFILGVFFRYLSLLFWGVSSTQRFASSSFAAPPSPSADGLN